MDNSEYTHTVVIFGETKQSYHFPSHKAAINYANKQLRKGVKCKIYPYRDPRGYVDVLIERY